MHRCPECGQACYCGGDIDDCQFDGTAEEARCGHCPDEWDEGEWHDEDERDYTDDDE